ncbi:hypothetical protein ACFLQZ_01540 [Acidobacteriota bacterium]
MKLRSKIQIFSFFFICFVFTMCFIGCEGKISVSTANLKDAIICKSVDLETNKPLEKETIFPPDSPEIFCSVALINASSDTEVTAEWYYLERDVGGITKKKITDYSLNAKGSVYLAFSLLRPDNGFPVGDYSCKLYLNGEEKFEPTFHVESQDFFNQKDERSDLIEWFEQEESKEILMESRAGSSNKRSDSVFLSDATMCMSVDPQSAKPDEIADIFPPDVPEIFCSVKISNAPKNTAVISEWIFVKGEEEGLENYKISEHTLKATGSTYLSISLERSDRTFPRGNYLLKLSVNGKEQLRVPFKVQ